MKSWAFAFLLALACLPQRSWAGDLAAPTGPVVLTIAGAIENANRGALDPVADSFLNYHDLTFEGAAAFDLAMLEALGTASARIAWAGWPELITFEGPRLVDLLAAVGWQGDSVTTVALDGFATEMSRETVLAKDWILAIRANGQPLGVGQRGPLWLVHALPEDRPATDDEELSWPWAVFFMRVD